MKINTLSLETSFILDRNLTNLKRMFHAKQNFKRIVLHKVLNTIPNVMSNRVYGISSENIKCKI